MGSEFKGKGAHIALSPVAGPLGRSGYGGRNWEGFVSRFGANSFTTLTRSSFSPDPYLTGVLFEQTIMGMQSSGVQATAKRKLDEQATRASSD